MQFGPGEHLFCISPFCLTLLTLHCTHFQISIYSLLGSRFPKASTFRIYFIPSQSTSRLLKSLCILASSGQKLVCSDSDGTRICKNKNIAYVQHTSKTSLLRSCPPADGLRQLLLTSLNLIFPWVIPIDRINGSLARLSRLSWLSWLSWLSSPTFAMTNSVNSTHSTVQSA